MTRPAEEYDQQLRSDAVSQATRLEGTNSSNVLTVARNIYTFIKGENK